MCSWYALDRFGLLYSKRSVFGTSLTGERKLVVKEILCDTLYMALLRGMPRTSLPCRATKSEIPKTRRGLASDFSL
jgi:hypothetical protein